MKCCKTNAVINVHGNKFCREHFIRYYERKVEKIIKKLRDKKVLAAVSGGKDSMALAFLLYKFSKEYSFNFELLFIDLGIHRYSEKSKKVIEKFVKEKGVKLNVIKAKDEILAIDDINELKQKPRKGKQKSRQGPKQKLPKPICSYCGLIKRYLINKFAYENCFDLVVIGHNLDDEIAFIFMNMLNQNIEQLARIGIITETNKKLKLIGRIKPLYFCSEKENMTYCLINGIEFYNEECPYAINASQIKIKHLLNEFEKEKPGFKLNFLKSFLKLKENLKVKREAIKQCKICGYATTLDVCAFCRLKGMLR